MPLSDVVNPPPAIGPPEDQSTDHAQCGHLEINSVVDRWFPGVSIAIPDGASLPQIGAALATAKLPGVTWHSEYGTGAAALAWALGCIDGSGNAYPVILFQCDGATNPMPVGSTDIAHYITGYGTASHGASVLDYNCWTATLQSLLASALVPAYQGAIVISRAVAPAPWGAKDMKGAAYYDGPDGKHRTYVDGHGTLYDQRQLTPGSNNWSPPLNVLGITGLQPFGLLDNWVDTNANPARINLTLAGGLLDTPWVVCQGGTWSRLH